MLRACYAGVQYYGVIFALGFVLGALRVLLVAPALGEVAAVLLELPLMLAASWTVARQLAVRHSVMTQYERVMMGVLAFDLCMLSEVALAVFAFGEPVSTWAAKLMRTPGMLGLAGQIAFGLVPLLLTMPVESGKEN
jgi:hypothetical protein